jgi:hypothetical protein
MSEQDESIYDVDSPADASPGDKKTLSRRARLMIGIGAAVLVGLVGVLAPLLLRAEAASLAITVFSDGWSEVELETGVETPLNEYLASDSSVPGFPLRVSAPGADEVALSVDAGSLFTWGKPDYVAQDKGAAYSMAPGDTVYWSPHGADKALVPQCTLTVTARRDGADAAGARLILRQTGEAAYSVTLLAGE